MALKDALVLTGWQPMKTKASLRAIHYMYKTVSDLCQGSTAMLPDTSATRHFGTGAEVSCGRSGRLPTGIPAAHACIMMVSEGSSRSEFSNE